MKLRSLQVLRGVAALGVVLCHATDSAPVGAGGVDLFFVLSGFIIGRVAEGREPGAFAFDRFWRIFPIYWLAALPWFVVAAYIGMATPDRTIASFLLWPVVGDYVQPYLRPAWTLCFEVLFYAAMTVALVTRRGKWLVGLYLVLLAAGLYSASPLLRFVGNPIALEFLFGLAITRLPLDRAAGIAVATAGVIILALAPSAGLRETAMMSSGASALVRVFWWGLPAAAFVYCALAFESAFAGRRWNPAVLLGDSSYSLYLVHLSVIVLAAAFVSAPVVIAICVLAGFALHHYVEKPLLRFRKTARASLLPYRQRTA